jgi:hypothetical protein
MPERITRVELIAWTDSSGIKRGWVSYTTESGEKVIDVGLSRGPGKINDMVEYESQKDLAIEGARAHNAQFLEIDQDLMARTLSRRKEIHRLKMGFQRLKRQV